MLLSLYAPHGKDETVLARPPRERGDRRGGPSHALLPKHTCHPADLQTCERHWYTTEVLWPLHVFYRDDTYHAPRSSSTRAFQGSRGWKGISPIFSSSSSFRTFTASPNSSDCHVPKLLISLFHNFSPFHSLFLSQCLPDFSLLHCHFGGLLQGSGNKR